MRFYKTLLEPGGRLMARHLQRLCIQLQNLTIRLKESVATTVGQTVAGVVREVVHNLLGDLKVNPPPSNRCHGPDTHFQGNWHSSSQHHFGNGWDDDLDHFPYQDDLSSGELSSAEVKSPKFKPAWISPLTVGLQTFCYLRQRPLKVSLLAALGCGLATGLFTSYCTPLVVASAGLLSLVGMMQIVPDTLKRFGLD